MTKDQEVKKTLFNSKKWIQLKFIKLGLRAMPNKNLYDVEMMVLNHPKEKDSQKILELVYKEMDNRHMNHLKVGYAKIKEVKNERNKTERSN